MKIRFLIILLLLLQSTLIAQINKAKNISLNAVKLIEIEEHLNDLSGEILVFKVERDKANNWISTKTRSSQSWVDKDKISKEKFIRKVPISHLKELLNCFTDPVLTKDIKLFNISQDTLISHLDSMLTPLTTERKSGIVEDLKKPHHLQKAFEKLLVPRQADHKTLRQIKLITLRGDTITAESLSFADAYIPWKIEGMRVYDPKLSRLYNYLCGNERYERSRRHFFYIFLIYELLNQHGRNLDSD